MDIPKDLTEQLARGNCVAFVGSGISVASGLPTWPELLRQMISWSQAQGVVLQDRADIEALITDNEFLPAADELVQQMGNEKFRRFISEVFRRPGLRPNEAHLLVTEIPFSGILTTNYDKLLESAYVMTHTGEHAHVFTQMDVAELSAALRSGEFYILKTHGTADRIETIVLGKKQYRSLMHSNPGYQKALDTLFSSKTILFIGFGLNDPDLLLHLDELQAAFAGYTGTHYALMDSARYNATTRRRYEADYGIQIIPYTPSTADHREVRVFLAELAKNLPKKIVAHSLARVRKILDEADPHYRLVINSENELIIKEKYKGAAQDHPLTISAAFSFDAKTPEGKAAIEAWNRFVNTGEEITIKSPQLTKFQPPEIIERFTEVPTEHMAVTFGSRPSGKKLPIRVVAQTGDGATAVLDNILLDVMRRGKEQMTLSNERQGGAWKIEQIIKFNTNQSNFDFHFNDSTQLNVNQAVEAWRFFDALSKGAVIRIESIETGLQLGHARVAPGAYALPDERLLEVLEALVIIQNKTGILFNSPDVVSFADAQSIFTTLEILQTGQVALNPQSILVESNLEQAKSALERFADDAKAYLSQFLEEFGTTIFGRNIPLGPVVIVYEQVYIAPVDYENLERAVASGPSETVFNIVLTPVEGLSPEAKFLNWLPSEEADKLKNFPAVKIQSLKTQIQKLFADSTQQGELDVNRLISLLRQLRNQLSDEGKPLNTLSTSTPEELREALQPLMPQLDMDKRFLVAAKFFEQGWLTSGIAAELINVPRALFLSRLGDYGVNTFNLDDAHLDQEQRLA
jgi:hypothetical protein